MAHKLTIEMCIQKYKECKLTMNGGIPEYGDFMKYAAVDKMQLVRLFGSSAYSKLQIAAGDVPNKLQLERTPLATIMQQYGGLVTEHGGVPAYSDWEHRELKPSVE